MSIYPLVSRCNAPWNHQPSPYYFKHHLGEVNAYNTLKCLDFGNCEALNAMEFHTESNQAACCDASGNLLHMMKGPELDNEIYYHCVYDKQESSQDSKAVPEKVDSTLASIKSDNRAVNVLNGEYCGLYKQLSIDYVDIFEILREEILAAEERELEVNGLWNAGEEDLEESPVVEGIDTTFVRDSELTGIDRDDCQGDVENCSFHNKASDVGDAAGFLQKWENGQAELPRSPSAGLLEDAFIKEVEGMGAENDEAAPLEEKGSGLEDRLESAEVREMGLAQDHQVTQEFERVESSTTTREGDLAQDHRVTEVVEHIKSSSTPREGGLAQDHQGAEEVELAECTKTTSKEGSFVEVRLSDNMVGNEQTSTHSNVEVDGNAFSREDEGAGTGKGKETMLDSSRGDDGDHLLQNDMSDKQSELSEDDEYTSIPFSGPIAFSGMLSYSGMLSQIPYSGNLSLHSDSSASTRSFAFPILASDWNSSPAKIGQPESGYFRRRRRWRPRFCCRRPTTLFD